MRKNIFKIFIVSMLCGFSELSAQDTCTVDLTCVDKIVLPFIMQAVIMEYKMLDMLLAEETIGNIVKKIDKSHNELEKDSKTILENTRRLNKEYYVVEQDILHNQILINELQSLLTDAIASSAEAEKSKNSLELLKKATK
jgi:hypothetical protein